MTDVAAEFAEHARFERTSEGFAPTTNDWTAEIAVDGDAVEIEVWVPTLDAATTEPVADVVEDGWYDTFDRRVQDADGVTLADDVTVTDVSKHADDVRVALALDPREGKAADDALALVNYVEGTWFEGVIPGYDYTEKVQSMRNRAAQNAEGTPL
ncbi:DUF5813 family protein [Halobacterium litoreum]|uniref:DUF5813 family protein n=1 Tax=Halobacterium litoreum TaxID=2039234 RepID=A0ABD5NDW2_9EURY|nr:DUF5813 family protein [Halobacterium litoreum]UHH13743.1 DUF5813 family protein [Halobacterium litoreum]